MRSHSCTLSKVSYEYGLHLLACTTGQSNHLQVVGYYSKISIVSLSRILLSVGLGLVHAHLNHISRYLDLRPLICYNFAVFDHGNFHRVAGWQRNRNDVSLQ
jgi:hypothetical protein